MKRLTMRSLAAVALLALTSYSLWWRSRALPQSTASVGMPSIMELQSAANSRRPPIQDIEDLSLVYPSVPRSPYSWKEGRDSRVHEQHP
jgi:hypothetical protein